jgi:hypothetical protein
MVQAQPSYTGYSLRGSNTQGTRPYVFFQAFVSPGPKNLFPPLSLRGWCLGGNSLRDTAILQVAIIAEPHA